MRKQAGFCLWKRLLDEHAQTEEMETHYENYRQVVLNVQNDKEK